jgi:hypothetical protein
VSGRYEKVLDWGLGVVLFVDYTTLKGEVVDYSLALLLKEVDGVKTIRVYDGAHGFNEMHRYGQATGRQRGVQVHRGTLGEGMNAAIATIEASYVAMIEGWRGA